MAGSRHWLAFVGVGLATLCVFLPSLANGFVDWDDDRNLLNNLAYRGLGLEQLRWMWTTFHLGPYQPLSWMSFGLDYLIWGMRPLGYHLTSALLHALSAALFAFVAFRLFIVERSRAGTASGAAAASGPSGGGSALRGAKRSAAGSRGAMDGVDLRAATAFGVLAALIWAAHPLRVEAVSWATERREVLCGAFSLLALALHLARKGRWPVALATLAAMLSKGTAVVLPPLLVLVDLHAEAPVSLREWASSAIRSARRHALPLGFGAVFAIVAIVGQRAAGAVAPLEGIGFIDRLALFANGLGFYAVKTVWPFGLAPLYEMSSDLSGVRLGGAISAAALAATLALALRGRPPSQAPLLLIVAYAILVAPVGGLVQVGYQIAADRYAYAAGWALSLLAAAVICATLARVARASSTQAHVTSAPEAGPATSAAPRSSATSGRASLAATTAKEPDAGRSASRGASGILVAAMIVAAPLAWLSVRQQRVWRDPEALWTHQLEAHPETATAHYSLALLHVTRDRDREADRWAEPHFREAIRLQPGKPDAYRGLGNVLRRTGRLDEAVKVYQDGLALSPRNGPLLYGLATAQWDAGERAEAIATLRALASIPPETSDSHLVLARALAAFGDVPGAIAEYGRAITAPGDAPAVAPMELAWLLATHPDARYRDGRRAVELARLASELGRDLAARGGLALRRGLDARISRTMAAALAEAGDFPAAETVLRESAALRAPDQAETVAEWLSKFSRREPIRASPGFP